MRFGVMLIGPYEGDMDPAQMSRQSRLQARTAAANNFEALFTAQHYLSGPAAAMMQPLVLLVNLAAEAEGLYLGTALYLLPPAPSGGGSRADRHNGHHFRRQVFVRRGTGLPGPRV